MRGYSQNTTWRWAESLFVEKVASVHLVRYCTSKQNITRDIEIKNKLTVTRGEVGGDNGRKGVRVFRNNYKGHIDKTKGV